jgi:hypothetical protein
MRLNTFVPRLVILAAVWLLATATLTLAAGHKMSTPSATPPVAATTATPTPLKVLVVPSVANEAYVFAKGILEDGGFGWKVGSGALGFPGNVVVGQSPAAGTRVIDTGAPRIVLTLRKSGVQNGLPDATSPFTATAIKLADLAVARKTTVAPRKTATKPAVKPAAKPAAKPVAKPAVTPQVRKPDFVVPGVKAEPQNELSLPDRARALDRWLARKPLPSDANVGRWLYQQSWIVTGAQFGWWHGAEALQILIAADQRAQTVWGIGTRSELLARKALAEVKASSH